jgi:hypothetical protein
LPIIRHAWSAVFSFRSPKISPAINARLLIPRGDPYLDDAHIVSVQRATSNYRRLWRRLEELTEINLKLLAFPAGGDDA